MRTASARYCIGAVVVAGLLLAAAGPAASQEDPYGGTTTTTRQLPRETPACDLSVTAGAPGTPVRATVTGVSAGDTVRVVFDGADVGRAEAEADGAGSAAAVVDFRVPTRPPGTYDVVAVGASFTASCGPEEGGGFGVLSAGVSQGGRSPLPRTGVYVGLLLAGAAALIVFGRGILAEGRRRRRRAQPRHAAPLDRTEV